MWVTHHFGYSPKVVTVNHQTAHLASAYYQSGFDEAMCISYDAYGDGISGSIGVASKEGGLKILEALPSDNSLGVFYATMTSFLGFKPGEDEYKVMGLAPYGAASVDLSFFCKPTTSGYYCDPIYFRSSKSGTQYEPFYSEKLVAMLGEPRRKGEKLNYNYKNIAASTQATLEESIISLVTRIYNQTGQRNLCLAGGVALNCSANRVISKLPFIKNLFIQPASSDRGLALGCAMYAAVSNGEPLEVISHVFYGPTRDNREIEDAIKLTGVNAKRIDDPSMIASQLLAEGKIIAWYQGRSEFGPRALGHRSILADPGLSTMKDEINKRVKFREEFRPFAPSVLEERYMEIYDLNAPSPYMTVACDVKDGWGDRLPATTHVNNTARVQTVNKETDTNYHALIKNFEKLTGRPVVLNTSFNIMGQPIVEKPLEALANFYSCGIDALLIGNYIITKQ